MMDTGTVRLVIFLGMFLIFASDYGLLISTIFGNGTEQNSTLKKLGGAASEGPALERANSIAAKAALDEDNGKRVLQIRVNNINTFWRKNDSWPSTSLTTLKYCFSLPSATFFILAKKILTTSCLCTSHLFTNF